MYVCAQMYLSMIRIDMRKRIRRGNGWNPADSHVDLQGETVKEDRTYSKNTCLQSKIMSMSKTDLNASCLGNYPH